MPQADPHLQNMAASIVKFFDSAERPPRGGWVATIRGREYVANTESGVVDAVRDTWINNGTYRDDSEIRAELWQFWCAREPDRCRQPGAAHAGYATTSVVSVDGSQPADWKTSDGPKAWAKFHFYAAALYKQGSIDEMAVRRWLELFRREIACFDCRQSWELDIAKLPPAFSTAQAFFEWSVAIHNAVNSRVGHPQFPLAEAYNLYTT